MTVTSDADDIDALDAIQPNGNLSVLGQLSEIRERIVEADFHVLPVPRWEGQNPEVFVRYKPVDHDKIRKAVDAGEKAPKQKRAEIELNANIDILIEGCVGVFGKVRGVDGEWSLRPGDPEAEQTRFDHHLAENLGMPDGSTARQVVKRLFISDGDIMSHVASLTDFSGYRETVAAEAIPGE